MVTISYNSGVASTYFSIMVVNFIMCDRYKLLCAYYNVQNPYSRSVPCIHLHLQRDYITKLPADWSMSTLLWNDTIPLMYFTYTCSHIVYYGMYVYSACCLYIACRFF